jgi:hypothetical protein
MFLATLQHTNSAYDRYIIAFPTSLMIGACAYVNIIFAISNFNLFCVMQVGAALGSSLGVYIGNRIKKSGGCGKCSEHELTPPYCDHA